MRVELFKDIAARYSGIIGRRDGVRVIFKPGDTACTDGKTIIIPEVPYGTILTEHQAKVFGGYLDHEAAHLRETDFIEIAGLGQLERWIYNVIEDVRIERIQINRYAGMRVYLDALCREVDSRDREKDGNKVLAAIYRECWEPYREVNTFIPWHLDRMGLGEVRDLLTGIPSLKSSRDARLLAHRVVEKLGDIRMEIVTKQNNPWMSVKGQQGAGEQRDNPYQGKQEAKGQESKSGESKSGEPTQGKEFGQAQGEKETQQLSPSEVNNELAKLNAKQPGQEETRISVLVKILKGDIDAQAMKQVPTKGRRRWFGDQILPPACSQLDKINIRPDRRRERLEPPSMATARLQREMMRVLLSRDKTAWRRDQEDGDLDGESLYSVATGNTRLYAVKRERRAINTAIELVLDCSGSMSTAQVRQITAVLINAWKPIPKLAFEVAGFRGTDLYDARRPTEGGRSTPMRYEIFKGFDESVNQAKEYLGGISCHGYTPLGDAYAVGMENIIKRKEPRKILWVVTDGMPEIQVINGRHNELLFMTRTKEQCKRYGIMTVGFGVKGVDLRDYFEYFKSVAQGDLLQAMLALTEQML